MSTLAESLGRLYLAENISLTKLDQMLVDVKITQDEYNYITAQ